MDAREFIAQQFDLDLNKPSPIEIPNQGREMLGGLFKDLGYKVGAEIGVEGGKFSLALLEAHPKLELYCIDPWQSYDGYIDPINDKNLPEILKDAQEKLQGFNVHFIQDFSMRAVRNFADASLDFVYIDANHNLPYVMDDIIQWSKKVRPGGIVAGHDYVRGHRNRPTVLRVVEAVNWYTELKPIKTWFLIGTKAKVEGQIRDTSRSWFWIKD
jgi:predicted O-methyltransferase YrrM